MLVKIKHIIIQRNTFIEPILWDLIVSFFERINTFVVRS
jgi:hypothetical protein